MKKIVLIFFIVLPFIAKCFTYTSIGGAHAWESAASWTSSDGGVSYPKIGDNATIAVGSSITVNSADNVNNLTVLGTLTVKNGLWIYALLTNSGTVTGTSVLGFRGINMTVMTGNGSYSGMTDEFVFTGVNQTIDATVNIQASTAAILCSISTNNSNVSVINNGIVNINTISNNSTTLASSWTNAANSSLTLHTISFTQANSSLIASASGNTVIFGGTSSYTIVKPSGGVYYNLTCSTSTGHVLTLPAAITVSNNLLISSGALDVSTSSYALSVGGNWTNNSTTTALVQRTGTVTLSGSAGQTIGGSFSTNFYNLTATGTGAETVTLACNETVTNNFTVSGGTFDCQTFQLTGNTTGTLSLAAGSTLLLGKTASATNVAFPTNFTAGAHISLAPTSTVEYLANTASQIISIVPTYGNLLIDAGSAITKTASGTPLSVGGNLTINTNATLSETTRTLSVTGTSTINGGLTYSTGSYNATGAVTNAGTLSFTTGAATLAASLNNSGSVTYTGAGTMSIGTTLSNSGTYTAGTSTLSVTGTSSLTAGTLSFTTGVYHATGAVTNAGTLSFTTGAATLTASLNNSGTVTYTGAGTMSIGTTLTNSGTYTAGTSTLSVTGTSSLTAGTLSFTTGAYHATGAVTNAGTLSFTTGAATLAASLNNSGTVTYTGAGTMSIGTTLTNSGTYTAGTSTLSVTGTSSLTAGTLSFTTGNYNATGAVTNAGALSFTTGAATLAASLNNSGTVTYTGAGTMSIGTTLTNSGTYTAGTSTLSVTGTSSLTAGTLSFTTGNYNATGAVTNAGALSFTTGAATLAASLNNSGSVTYTGAGTMSIGTTLSNSGTYTAGTSTLSVTGTSSLTAGTLSFTTGIYNATGLVTNAATLTFTTGTGNLSNGLTNSGTTTFTGAGILNIAGAGSALDNTGGTFNSGTGAVNMTGTTQTISGNAISFYDLGINQTSSAQTVTLNASESFQDVLTMTTGTLAASGANTMTLLSNAARTARIAQVITPANTNITAKFVVQRYVAGRNTAAYAALSSPVQSAQTIMDWNDNNQTAPNILYMSGVGGPNGKSANYVSVFLYNETLPHGTGGVGNFVAITSYATPGNTYTVTPGQGIYLWLGTTLSKMSNPYTYITNGIPSIAPAAGISVNVTNSGAADGNGYNLLGNPFCSPIDWATFQAANPSLGATFGLRQVDGSWHYYGSGSIPMGQGFMVIASGAATINFNENQKTAVDASFLRPEKPLVEVSDEPNAINFTLSDDANNWSSNATILFGNNYTKTYKFGTDMPFIADITEGAPALHTVSPDGYNLSVYRLPDNEIVQTVPLVTVAQVVANHTITVNGLDNISSYQCVNLIDQATGSVLNNFNTNPSYTFNVSQQGEIKNFVLQFTRLKEQESCNTSIANNSDISNNITITPSEQGAKVIFNLPQESNATISIYNVLGQKIMNDVNTAAYNNQLTINLTQGHLYIIKVQTANGIVTKKLYR
jgi:hypothetical protein